MNWFRRRKGPMPTTPDVINKTALEVVWLDKETQFREFGRIAKVWSTEANKKELDEFLVLGEAIWEGDQKVFARPHVATVQQNGSVVGILSGYITDNLKEFFIEQLAVHPKFTGDSREAIENKLVEAAIDMSIAEGHHGWVTCSSDAQKAIQWQNLGFSKQKELPNGRISMAKMGYFG